MKARSTMRNQRRESGIALLIAIFVLLLISVVGIALIVSSGTESALAGNYRSATGVYYAALSGLEEARGRLLAKNPNSFQNTDANFLPAPGTPLVIGNVYYITNPVGAEDVLAAYPDNEYAAEFGAAPANVNRTASVSGVGGVQVPLYKWVRINAISENSLKVDFDGHPNDSTTPVFYDNVSRLLNTTSSGNQVLEITSLAALPDGTQKVVQYLAAPVPLNLNFPAALTLDGNNPQFTASPSGSYYVQGIDQGSTGTCNPNPAAPSIAVGYTDTSVTTSLMPSIFEKPGNPQGIPAGLLNNYTNGSSPTPNVSLVSVSSAVGCPGCNLTTVAGLNALVQAITQNADVVVNGNATGANMPAAMSATNPMTIVINGDLVFNGWRQTGYGLLLVTGEFTYDPDASWDGIILVIGKGWMYSHQGAYTNTQIQGAVFLARTLDASGNPLPPSSAPIFTAASSGFDFHSTPNNLTNGIYYSNCWIQAAMPAAGYQVLSFHEIASQ